jgi:hypothetical protein
LYRGFTGGGARSSYRDSLTPAHGTGSGGYGNNIDPKTSKITAGELTIANPGSSLGSKPAIPGDETPKPTLPAIPTSNSTPPPIPESIVWAMTKAAGASLGNGIVNLAKGGYNIVKEMAFTVVDIEAVRFDAVATLAGYPLGWEEWSAQGKSYKTSSGLDIATNAGRAGLAGGTLGASEIVIGLINYAQDGDADALQQHMGSIVAGNLAAAGTIKLGQVIKNNKVTFIDQMTPDEAVRYQKYWHDPKLKQYTPGVGELRRTQVSENGRYTYEAVSHFDEFGRLRAETHYTTHLKTTGVLHPNPHYHLFDRIKGKLTLMSGEYLGE